jgi:hypothetical protein
MGRHAMASAAHGRLAIYFFTVSCKSMPSPKKSPNKSPKKRPTMKLKSPKKTNSPNVSLDGRFITKKRPAMKSKSPKKSPSKSPNKRPAMKLKSPKKTNSPNVSLDGRFITKKDHASMVRKLVKENRRLRTALTSSKNSNVREHARAQTIADKISSGKYLKTTVVSSLRTLTDNIEEQISIQTEALTR